MSGLLLLALAMTLDLQQILSVVRQANLAFLGLALLIIILIRVLMAWRWQVILKTYQLPVSFRELISIIFVSNTLGHFLPGGVGADLIRGHQISKKYQHQQIAEVSATIILDRLIGFLSMFLLALTGALSIGLQDSSSDLIMLLIVLNIAFIIGFFTVYCLHGWFDRIAPTQGKIARIWKKFSKLIEACTNISKIRKILLPIFAISVLVQLSRCLVFLFIYQSLGEFVSLIYYLAFIPLVFVLMLLPISIGGFGVREGALLYFFSTVGVASEVSVAAGFLFYILQLLAFAPGLFFLLFPVTDRSQELERE